jgi:hypothetical protein
LPQKDRCHNWTHRNRDDPDRSRRFIKTARQLGCDEEKSVLDEKLKRIAKATPADSKAEADR